MKNSYHALVILTGLALAQSDFAIGCSTNSDCASGESCKIQSFRLEPGGPFHKIGICRIVGPSGVEATECSPYSQFSCWIQFRGSITKEKVGFVQKVVSSYSDVAPRKNLTVTIDSNGGDVDAAMQFGRILRRNEAMISLIDQRSICASSCVFVLSGAVQRNVGVSDNVIIHRPFGGTAQPQDMATANLRWKAWQDSIRNYLTEMNIPISLLDAMNAIPSEQGRRLSDSELSLYLLNGDDPAYTEKQDSSHAAKLGTSREEYLRRKSVVERCKNSISTADAEMFAKMYVKCGDYYKEENASK